MKIKKIIVLSLTFSLLNSAILAGNIKKTPWPMFQQNPSHTGYVEAKLDTTQFTFGWKAALNKISKNVNFNDYLSGAVCEGNFAFVKYGNVLHAFSIEDGKEVWRKDFSGIGLNPPSVMKGKVYVQTVNNYSPDTALYAYDAKSGSIIFKSPTYAQWESYLAPTIFADGVYVDGGSYGGMYSFNKDSGQQNWFVSLDQYDMWTPAVNNTYAIAYTGGNLHVIDRVSGKGLANITDPHFDWHGYSSDFAPVLIDDHHVLTIQSGYLSLFDVAQKQITWAQGPGFVGQPSYDNEFIYASYNDGLVVLDKNGQIQWRWYQDNERVQGQMIITKNLILLTTNKNMYAISKKKHTIEWAFTATGSLSLGMGYLFILDNNSHNLFAIKVA